MSEPLNEGFARSLQNLMERRDLLQQDLAGEVGVAQSAVSNYLKGRVPRAEIVQRLADYFGVAVERLLNGTISKKPRAIAILPKESVLAEKKRLADLRDKITSLTRAADDLEWQIKECEHFHKTRDAGGK